jgi:hypothetical protein
MPLTLRAVPPAPRRRHRRRRRRLPRPQHPARLFSYEPGRPSSFCHRPSQVSPAALLLLRPGVPGPSTRWYPEKANVRTRARVDRCNGLDVAPTQLRTLCALSAFCVRSRRKMGTTRASSSATTATTAPSGDGSDGCSTALDDGTGIGLGFVGTSGISCVGSVASGASDDDAMSQISLSGKSTPKPWG